MIIELPDVDGVSHRYVNVNGLRFHVAEAGCGDPVLLLHGWPQHWYQWRHLIPSLAKRYKVLCPDLRGFGWSDVPRKGYEKEQLATDIINLLDALNLERIYLVGHDWGGWVGFLICLRVPDRVRKYVALNIPHPYQKIDLRKFRSIWRFWYQLVIAFPGAEIWVPLLVRHFLRRTALVCGWSSDEIEIYYQVLQQPKRARASVLLYRIFLLKELLPLAKGKYCSSRLYVPTLLLFGTRDQFISTMLLKGYEPYVEQMTIEPHHDSGHFIVEQKPDLVAAKVKEFFKT